MASLHRTGSITSISSAVSTAPIFKTKPLPVSKSSELDWIDQLQGKNWFNIYSSLTCGKIKLEAVHFYDLLKILCDFDAINDTVACHILSLIEQRCDLLKDDEELLEQILGTLLNSINVQLCNRTFNFQRRVLLTCSNLFLTFSQLTLKSPSISSLFKSTIKRLLKEVTNKTALASASKECLSALIEVFPNSFAIKPKGSSKFLLPEYELMEELTASQESVLIGVYCDTNPEMLNHCLYMLMKDQENIESKPIWSPSIFKQFLGRFLFSSQMYQVHFLILLLKKYHILFTTAEERSLFHQLALLSKHPSLSVSQRLLILEFIYAALDQIKASECLDHPHFLPIESDGPDTLEKKLCILSRCAIGNDDLLIQLQSLTTLSLEKGNSRATKSLYRVLSHFLTYRSDTLQQVEAIVIGLIMASPKCHVENGLSLLTTHSNLAVKVCSAVISKVLTCELAFKADANQHLSALFTFIQWTLEKCLLPREMQLSSLLTLLYETTQKNSSLVPNLLSCIAATIRFICLDDEERNLLRQILLFISNSQVGKSNVTLSSWAQLFTIAINSPCDTIGLQSVLSTDSSELTKLSTITVEDVVTSIDPPHCPVVVRRVEAINRPLDANGVLELQFKLTLAPDLSPSGLITTQADGSLIDYFNFTQADNGEYCSSSPSGGKIGNGNGLATSNLQHTSNITSGSGSESMAVVMSQSQLHRIPSSASVAGEKERRGKNKTSSKEPRRRSSPKQQAFAITLQVYSSSQGHWSKHHFITLTSHEWTNLTVPINLANELPFTLSFSVDFCDQHGHIYQCLDFHSERVTFDQMLFPLSHVKCKQSFEYTWREMKEQDSPNNSLMESVIQVTGCNNLATFYNKHPWLGAFSILEDSCYCDNGSPRGAKWPCDQCKCESASESTKSETSPSTDASAKDATAYQSHSTPLISQASCVKSPVTKTSFVKTQTGKSENQQSLHHHHLGEGTLARLLAIRVLPNGLILARVYPMDEFGVNLHIITFNHKAALLFEQILVQ